MRKILKKTKEEIKKIKEASKLRSKEYYENNKDKVIERMKSYYKDNKIKILSNKKKIDKYQKQKNNFIKNLKNMISLSYREANLIRPKNIETILGISYNDFILYIQTFFNGWVNWDNYGYQKNKTSYTYWILVFKNKKLDINELNKYENFHIKIMEKN